MPPLLLHQRDIPCHLFYFIKDTYHAASSTSSKRHTMPPLLLHQRDIPCHLFYFIKETYHATSSTSSKRYTMPPLLLHQRYIPCHLFYFIKETYHATSSTLTPPSTLASVCLHTHSSLHERTCNVISECQTLYASGSHPRGMIYRCTARCGNQWQPPERHDIEMHSSMR
jgi:hypothetical protein